MMRPRLSSSLDSIAVKSVGIVETGQDKPQWQVVE
jgi:hypothetical protein